MNEQPIPSSIEPTTSSAPHALAYATPHTAATLGDVPTRGDVACLAIKIIGFYQLAEAIPGLALVAEYFQYGGSYVIAPMVRFAIHLAIGFFLLSKGETLARWLLPRTAVIATESHGSVLERFQAIAFSVLGLFLFVSSFPSLAWTVAYLVFGDNHNPIQVSALARNRASLPALAQYGVESSLGVWLFFGSQRLSGWWWSLRKADFTPIEPIQMSSPQDPK